MPSYPKTRYSIQELADHVDVSRRAVRYYVQRGLLDAPHGKGRGSYYTAEHLEKLIELKVAQSEGLSLEELDMRFTDRRSTSIKERYTPDEERSSRGLHPTLTRMRVNSLSRSPLPPPSTWWRVNVGADIELSVKEGALSTDELIGLQQLFYTYLQSINKTGGDI
jgi:DNA-binding transcriptional MerR regulator